MKNTNRNPVTGRFESNKCNTCTGTNCSCDSTAQTAFNETTTCNYGYYSKVLQKPFDTLAELTAAEKAFIEAENAKKKATESKREDANKVEAAFKQLNAAKRAYNENVLAAKKQYLAEVGAAKEKLNDRLAACDEELIVANTSYDEALKEFIKAHPEGYHVTLKDDDNVVTLSNQSVKDEVCATDFLNMLLQMFN